jgi:hypothetical protein
MLEFIRNHYSSLCFISRTNFPGLSHSNLIPRPVNYDSQSVERGIESYFSFWTDIHAKGDELKTSYRRPEECSD